jgi:hypothetical protein
MTVEARAQGSSRPANVRPARSWSDAEYDFAIATPADEPEVRRLVGRVAMPGAVSVRFAREPDYGLGATIMGDPCDVVVARRRGDGVLAGILCRGERRVFLNGEERRVGYIGQIRAAPGFRGRWLLQRGLPLFRELGPPDMLYEGVVASENPRARALLLERRPPGRLHAVRLCGLTSLALLLRPRPLHVAPGLRVAQGSAAELEEIVAFLRRVGAGRQLFPAHRVADFTDGRTLRDLAPEDLAIGRRDGRIVGVVGSWDQRAYKQEVVEAYGPWLQRARPLYDLAARLSGARPLPRVGEQIQVAFAAPVCVEGDDPAVFRALLDRAMERARTRGLAMLMAGFPDADPLLAEARRTIHVTYRSDLFLFSWATPAPAAGLDARLPYCEIATL